MNDTKTRGNIILIKKSISSLKILGTSQDLEARILCVEIEIENHVRINLINIYAPNLENEQYTFLSTFYDFILSKKNILLAGDFNAVTNYKDRIGKTIKKN